MSISIVAAVSKNNVIGRENALPWYLPEDLKHFKELTTGKIVLMGRKTFESVIRRLGQPLPNRLNIVITKDSNYKVPSEVIVSNDLSRTIEDYKDKDLFIIGGGQIFSQTIDKADTLYITHVEFESKGDSFFPEIDPAVWNKVEEEKHENFSFVKYQKNNKQILI